MPEPKIDDVELLERLTEIFRLHGYAGASLRLFTEATGLQRASLYHRFPGGKAEMAEAVLARADDWFVTYILAPLSEQGDPATRIRRMAKRLGKFYGGGSQSCLLDSLSLGEAENPLQQHVHRSFAAWLDALISVSREAGATPALARGRAEAALMQIQGGLVFARATGDRRPFRRLLAQLPAVLLGSDTG